MQFLTYSFKHWNCHLILLDFSIDLILSYSASPTLSIQTLEFLPADPFKHWTSYLILLNIGILPLFFWTWEFLPYFFETLDFLPFPLKLWNSYLFLSKIRIPILSFETLEFLPYPFKHWNSYPILLNIGIPTLSF